MTSTFDLNERTRRTPEAVSRHGTAQARVLKRGYNPRYYDLMTELEQMTGSGIVLNNSLRRDSEPVVSSPMDALNLSCGLGLQFLIMKDILVVKQ